MATTSRKIPLICSGHSRPVPDLAYSPITEDGFFIVSACLDGKPMLRNGVTGDWLGTFVGHKGAVWSAHINSTADKVVTGSADYTAKIWNALSGEEMFSFAHARIIKSVCFSKDNSQILTGGQDKILRIFDLSKPEAEPISLEGHTQQIKTALWSDQNTIISGGQDSTFRVWDTRTMKEVKSHLLKNPILSVEASLDNKHIVITSGKEVSFFDNQRFELVKTHSLTIESNSASLAPDSNSFVVGGTDFWVRVYDFNTGKELECHKGHHGPVHCVRFAPDGATFASGSEDGTIRLWQSGEPKCYGLWQEYKEKDSTPKVEIAT
jgi:serine-threonine kinase receptor-associated protein